MPQMKCWQLNCMIHIEIFKVPREINSLHMTSLFIDIEGSFQKQSIWTYVNLVGWDWKGWGSDS